MIALESDHGGFSEPVVLFLINEVDDHGCIVSSLLAIDGAVKSAYIRRATMVGGTLPVAISSDLLFVVHYRPTIQTRFKCDIMRWYIELLIAAYLLIAASS
jgi:hypothetical protein